MTHPMNRPHYEPEQQRGKRPPLNEKELAYLRRNPDVAGDRNFLLDPASHYARFGSNEGRMWGLDPAPAPAAAAPMAPAQPAIPAAPDVSNIYPGLGGENAQWQSYLAQARASSEGMNRMPHVFANFGAIPGNPAMANALFYADDPRKELAGNPLLSGFPDR